MSVDGMIHRCGAPTGWGKNGRRMAGICARRVLSADALCWTHGEVKDEQPTEDR